MAEKATPKPPFAVPRIVRGPDGLMHTVYYDPQTNQPVSNLKGYTLLTDSGQYYKVTDEDDADDDGDVDTTEVQQAGIASTDRDGRTGHTTARDADSNSGKGTPNTNAADNYGYQSKPGWVGPASAVVGMVNPALGMAAKVGSAAWNANNASAVSTARNMLGLPDRTGVKGFADSVKGVMKDNKGQISNSAKINGQNYSIGFEAMSPAGKTNLTPTEANQRANLLGGITEEAETEMTNAGKSRVEKATGISKGWATRALDSVFGVTPDKAPAPTQSPTARPENMPSITPSAAQSTAKNPGVSTPAGVESASKSIQPGAGLANLAGAAGKAAADYSGIGTGRSVAPEQGFMDAVGRAATAILGLGAKIDVTSGTYTPEKTAAINNARAAAAAKPGATKASIDAAGKKAGQVGSTRHTTAKAVDFSAIDPATGKPATAAQMQDIAAQFTKDNPEAGVGIGKGYMDKDGVARAHLDLSGQKGSWATSQAMKETIDAARAGYNSTPFSNPGTPTARPSAPTGFVSEDDRSTPTDNYRNAPDTTSPEVDRNYAGQGVSSPKAFASQDEKANTGSVAGYRGSFVSQDERASLPDRMGVTPASLSPTAHKSVFDSISPSQKATAQAVSSTTSAKLGTTPAAMAAMGFTNRTPAEKQAMAKTLAGELSQSALAGIKARDPKALAEFGSMIATIENRASSKKYADVAAVQSPTQYNSLMAANMATTNANYSKYAAALKAAQDDYYSGKIPGVKYNATSYYNPDISNPAWGAKMADPSVIGEHNFGNLPEYGPNQAAQDAAKAMGVMAGTNFSPGKQKDDNVGVYSGSGTSLGGRTGQSSGAGYTPGGMNSPSGSGFGGNVGYSSSNSPSESGGRFGGSGLGSPGGSSRGGTGTGTSPGGSAGMSGGGGYSPGGMGSPSGSSASSGTSSGSAGRNSGTGLGGGAGTNANGGSKGAQGRSEGDY